MFLSRMPLNPARRGTRRLLGSPQALHAAVLAGFSDVRETDGTRVLWRLDRYPPHRVFLYVVSPDKPDFTHVVEQAGWPTTEAWETRAYDDFLDSLRRGQRWQFRLTANPVRSGRREGWPDTKPLPHVTVEQQEKWLLDRAERLGFTVVPSAATGPDQDAVVPDLAVVDRSIRRFDRKGTRVTIATATFQGQLEVTDVKALQKALVHGLGRAKAYGCGLMTLARIPAASS